MPEILIKIHIEQLDTGTYLATSDDVPGLVAQGRTVAETIEIAQDVTRKLIESYIEHGDELPQQLRRKRPQKFEIDIPLGVSAWDA